MGRAVNQTAGGQQVATRPGGQLSVGQAHGDKVGGAGTRLLPPPGARAAAKGGVIAALKSLALELAKRRITVNGVAPG
ncbi:SDR family oxidoreductase, partial [Kushneria aurantia]